MHWLEIFAYKNCCDLETRVQSDTVR